MFSTGHYNVAEDRHLEPLPGVIQQICLVSLACV
jgi:hypothetical protein